MDWGGVSHPQSAEAEHLLEKHISSHGETGTNGHKNVEFSEVESMSKLI
jgi:hypothetical protein